MDRKLQTQTRLIASTRDLIIEAGMEACTLENICQRAGFSRGAFYSNFGTKDSLLAALAEDEYAGLIDALNLQVARWAKTDSGQPQTMETLLAEAINALGFGQALYILHSEMLMRSIRNPKWGARLLAINAEFVASVGAALETILRACGRELTYDLRALTHAVIAVVTRAAGIDAWRQKSGQNDAAAAGATEQILGTVLVLLYGASKRSDQACGSADQVASSGSH